MNQDLDHLRILSIFHYVVGGIVALFACFPLIHLAIGLFALLAPEKMNPPHPSDAQMMRLIGVIFVGIASLAITVGWTLAICLFVAGRNLASRRHYTYCLVIAGIACIFMPFGTVLGIFTIIVLMRPSVKALFEQSASVASGGPNPR
jgi:hypothetical protein